MVCADCSPSTHLEFDVFVLNGFNVEADRWNGGDDLANL